MKPEYWQKVKAIFDSVLEIDKNDRERYLAAACEGDAIIRGHVEEMLSSYDTDFLEPIAVNGEGSRQKESQVLRTGDNIGRYKVIRLLGVGGMGEVYLARDETLDRLVCIKVFLNRTPTNQMFLERFVREARSASALNNPHICTVYEINTDNDPPFIAMEYIEGKTLAETIALAKLDANTAIDIALQVADGLADAHKAGIVHRDIKPANIIINKRGAAKILDFGLAKKIAAELDDKTQEKLSTSGMIMGTVSYMSPEQARGQAVDTRTDVWSLGIVLFEMLTGQLPFAGETTGDVIASILRSEPSFIDDRISNELRHVLLTALAKDKEARYATAAQMAGELKNARTPSRSPGSVALQNRTTAVLVNAKFADSSPANGLSGVNRFSPYDIANSWGWQRAFDSKLLFPALLVLALVGSGAWYFVGSTSGRVPIESIAVMPFENDSGNTDTEYLSDGLTESLIGRLSSLPGISVKARNSVFRYKGQSPEPRTVGKELGVQAVVNGRILKRENDFSLYVELVDAGTENVLWKGEYNRPIANLVSVQSEIVRDVLANLRVKLSVTEVQSATRNYTENAEAYQLYLKGRYYWDKRTEESYKVAEDAYKQAIALDPNYALAYAGLADCFLFREIGLGRDAAMPKAKEYAFKALEIDESLAEAHTTLAFVNANYDLDFSSGEKEFTRAIELKPDYAIAHQFYGSLLVATGRFDKGLAEMRTAVSLEPYTTTINWSLGMGLGLARRYDESIAQLQKTLQLQPGHALSEGNLTGMLIQTGRFDDAMVLVQKHLAIAERRDGALSNLAIIYAKTGRMADARKTLASLLAESRSQNNPYNVARVYAAMDEKGKAVDWLNKAVERRSFSVWFMGVDPFLDPLHGDRGFDDLLRRIGLNG